MYVCMYVCMYACMYVCMYVFHVYPTITLCKIYVWCIRKTVSLCVCVGEKKKKVKAVNSIFMVALSYKLDLKKKTKIYFNETTL